MTENRVIILSEFSQITLTGIQYSQSEVLQKYFNNNENKEYVLEKNIKKFKVLVKWLLPILENSNVLNIVEYEDLLELLVFFTDLKFMKLRDLVSTHISRKIAACPEDESL